MDNNQNAKCQNGSCDTIYHQPVFAKLDGKDLCRECYLSEQTDRERADRMKKTYQEFAESSGLNRYFAKREAMLAARTP